ncbi:unnamed protein product [Malus baccata var. baccata]
MYSSHNTPMPLVCSWDLQRFLHNLTKLLKFPLLTMSLVGEVGELSEIFQWKGEVPKGLPDWKEEEKQHLGEELSDVLLYLVRLSDFCGVDLGKAALRKVELNSIKYHFHVKCNGQIY